MKGIKVTTGAAAFGRQKKTRTTYVTLDEFVFQRDTRHYYIDCLVTHVIFIWIRHEYDEISLRTGWWLLFAIFSGDQ